MPYLRSYLVSGVCSECKAADVAAAAAAAAMPLSARKHLPRGGSFYTQLLDESFP